MLWRLRQREASDLFELVPLVFDEELFDWRELRARILLKDASSAERTLPAGVKLLHRAGSVGEADYCETWGPAEMQRRAAS